MIVQSKQSKTPVKTLIGSVLAGNDDPEVDKYEEELNAMVIKSKNRDYSFEDVKQEWENLKNKVSADFKLLKESKDQLYNLFDGYMKSFTDVAYQTELINHIYGVDHFAFPRSPHDANHGSIRAS